jgi:hypothetical protein
VNGIDASKVKVVTAQATVESLLVGKMDYFLGWIVNQPYQIEQEAAKPDAPQSVKNKTWQALRLADLGVSDAEAKYPPVMSGDFLLSRFKATRKLWGAENAATVSNDAKLVERPRD